MCAEPFTPLTLARILRPWGRRGEVAAEILTDFPERLTTMREAWLASERNAPQRVTILSCRLHLGQAIFHFEGVNTISDAERIRGLEVQVPLAERVSLDASHYYITDLIGCQIWPEKAETPLGVVEDVQRGGAERDPVRPESWVLVAKADGRELLIPLAAEICTRIDTVAKRIEVRLPEGLVELNR